MDVIKNQFKSEASWWSCKKFDFKKKKWKNTDRSVPTCYKFSGHKGVSNNMSFMKTGKKLQVQEQSKMKTDAPLYTRLEFQPL